MSKNEDSNNITVKKDPINNSDCTYSKIVTGDNSALAPKKIRKDAKGIPIIKKKLQIKKTKHHIYFVDQLDPTKSLEDVVQIESYKKYNLDGEEVEEEEKVEKEDNKQIAIDQDQLQETKTIYTQKCCHIF